MRYLMLVCVAEDGGPSPEDAPTIGPRTQEWVDEMDRRGARLLGSQLVSTDQAKCVRVRGGKRSVTDGPFAETKEQVAGFDILECANIEEAVAIALKHPAATFGTLEVRQLMGD